jgi:NAD(P)H-flavin reductase/hemoglobin-like flavoprotein
VAIALDSGFPDGNQPGLFAGQPLWTAFSRRPEGQGSGSATVTETPRIPPQSAPAAELELSGQIETGAVNDARSENANDRISARDARLVKESFAAIEGHAQEAMEHFYAWLFVRHPEMRAMFPLAMSTHRERVFGALARIVWSMDSPQALTAYAGQLGRDHRKFGVKDKHYEAFFGVLLDTVRHFGAATWTAGTQAAWETALGSLGGIMRAAAAADARQAPRWWVGEILRHDLRGPDLAVLTIRPDQPLAFRPGQYVPVQVSRWPRVWRNFSIANAPRGSGLLDLHVRVVPGGMVSTALVHHLQAGDILLLGPARGDLAVASDSQRDLLCIAGGTGLAPMKAMIEGVVSGTAQDGHDAGAATRARRVAQRRITLYVGARTAAGLYDMQALSLLEASCPGLTVIPAVSHDPDWAGLAGLLPDVVRRHASCEGREVYISGPDEMVRATARVLARQVPGEHIHHDPVDQPAAGIAD